MHHADWAAHRLKEIDVRVEDVEALILGGSLKDFTAYRELIARRGALLDVRAEIKHAIGRDETR